METSRDRAEQSQVIVVMVPFNAQGHLNQLLHLSRLISAYDIPVHFISSTTHSRQAKLRVQGWDPLSVSDIHFHEYEIPSFLSPFPDPTVYGRFPSHLLPSWEASSHLREHFLELVSVLSHTARKVVIIHDYLMSSVVQDVVSNPKAEAYMFQCCSFLPIFCSYWGTMGSPFFDAEWEMLKKEIPPLDECMATETMEFCMSRGSAYMKFTSGTLFDTCKVIEGKFLDFVAEKMVSSTEKVWAVGPFNPVTISSNKGTDGRHKVLEWLDDQDVNSVIYVSFGTTTSLTNEQIHELAVGLEESEQKFIWVLRDADRGDIFEAEVRRAELPYGYEERVQGKGIGMVVREWAPQLDILAHPSTGGFMSHCGWNSSMESMTMGKPIAAWPMHSDQPMNAILVAKVLKVGIYVREWADKEELVTSKIIEEAVKRLMASKEGDEMRKKAAELGLAIRESVAEGGITRKELDSFINHIST